MEGEGPHNLDGFSGSRYTLSIVERFRYQSALQSDCWFHESAALTVLESLLPSPSQSDDSSCGKQAFFALFPQIPDSVTAHLGDIFKKGWLNRRDMRKMLRASGSMFEVVYGELPTVGLALIEWVGSWEIENFWGSDLRRTHWVAVIDGFVFDVNWSGWLPRKIWEESVLDDMISTMDGATGWRPHTGYQILGQS